MAEAKQSRLERLQAQLEAEQKKAAELQAARVERATKAKANAEPKLEHAKNRAAHWAAQVDELQDKIKGYDAIIGGDETVAEDTEDTES